MGGFFTTFEVSESRRDMAQTLGPMTLTITYQRDSESETGGPDLAEATLTDARNNPIFVPYRARPLRNPRTSTEGEQSVVVTKARCSPRPRRRLRTVSPAVSSANLSVLR